MSFPRNKSFFKAADGRSLLSAVAGIVQPGSATEVTWKQNGRLATNEPPPAKPAGDATVVYNPMLR